MVSADDAGQRLRAKGGVLDLTDADARAVPFDVIYDLCVKGRGVHPKGVRVKGALIEEPLDFEFATLTVPLVLSNCTIGNESLHGVADDEAEREPPVVVNLEQASGPLIEFKDCHIYGKVSAVQVHVVWSLSFDGCHVYGAVSAPLARVEGFLTLDNTTIEGPVNLFLANVGTLDVNDAFLLGPKCKGDALTADGMKASAVLVNNLVTKSAVTLVSADISHNVELNGECTLGMNSKNQSLFADGMKVGGYLRLSDDTEREGKASLETCGEVRLANADIAGQVIMSRAVLRTDGEGDSLRADGIRVGRDMLLGDSLTANGMIGLTGARVNGRLNLRNACKIPMLVLRDVHCSELAITKSAWPPKGKLVLVDLEFRQLDDTEPADDSPDFERRLDWVRRQGFDDWSPDPYEKLAAYYTRIGNENAARDIRIEKHNDELKHLKERNKQLKEGAEQLKEGAQRSTRFYRFWRRLYGWLVGYGYRRVNAGLLLGAVVVTAAFTFFVVDNSGAMVKTAPSEPPNQDCGEAYPCFFAPVYGADVVLPIIDFGQADAWRPNSKENWVGHLGEILRWVFIAIGWILASIFVAAFTGLVRRD